MAPTGSSTLSLRSTKNTASMTRTPAMMPMTIAIAGDTNAHGAVMATRPASMPLAIMPGSGLPVRLVIHSMADDRTERAGDRGVGGDDRELDVGGGERRRGVEAEPAEQQDERAEHRHRDVVARDAAWLAVGAELADPWVRGRSRRRAPRHRRRCARRPSRRSRRSRHRGSSCPRSSPASRRPTSTPRTAGSRSRRRRSPRSRSCPTSSVRPSRRSGWWRRCP